MYLRSLTLRGFKSFARKTVLEFQPGVTIIVGPNGSGKSNIADAVMWVLGEQSPTSLRGNRMEDVIFAGSASIRPVNMAEVVLTLDNAENQFPFEYAEVTVGRNVVRGGDSEYRLNNYSCRLLDIQELLSDAGVGRTLNSVISQGQLDDVLSCRPEERRDYIEEAGGLLKYRRRREKAQRRLERMEEELIRTGDVIREVRRLLRPLQRQAGRLERYTELNSELTEARLRLEVARLRTLQREWESHESVQRERTAMLEALDTELSGKSSDATRLEEEQTGWRRREAELRDGLYRLVGAHERLKALYSVWEEKLKHLAAGPVEADPELVERLAAERVEIEQRLDAMRGCAEELHAREDGCARRLVALNRELNVVTRESAGLAARLEMLKAAGGEDSLGATLLSLKDGREALLAERSGLEAEVALLEKAAGESLAKVEAAESALGGADGFAGLEELREVERRRAGLAATLELLTRLETERWDPARTGSALLEDDPTGGDLGGMLINSLEIPDEYEKAILAYLGPWAFGVLAKDTPAIKKAIKSLKTRGLGQSLFLRYKEGGRVTGDSGPVPEGAKPAREVVQAPEWFDDALDVLLHDTYIVGDLDAAFALAEEHPHLVFLTPDGDTITGGALVKGGSPHVSEVHLEMTARRRRALEDELASCTARIDGLELQMAGSDVPGPSSEARREREAAIEAFARRSEALAGCSERIRSLDDEIARLSAVDVSGTSEGELPELEGRLASLRERERVLTADVEAAETELSETAETAGTLAGELRAAERELAEARMRHAEIGSGGGGVARAEVSGQVETLMVLHNRLASLMEVRRGALRSELDDGVAHTTEAADNLRALREEVVSLQERHESLRDQVHTEDVAAAELKVRVETLVSGIIDVHKVPIDFALKQYTDEEVTPEMEERVERLLAELEHMGPVNPEAITEKETLEERYDFLRGQVADIEKARTQLRKVVTQIDREIETRFSETLESVNAHFMELFSFLFPNGSAELRLTDPDDLLNSGVEILAQPEGKRLRRISLLSGGETSLTALGFFFALFRVRPSPFYFLDEVEAALDDVNLHRFLELVKQFKEESQLILITHQKRSMEIADILYGVTMQDDGVSRVLSQKVSEAVAS
ncbi:MAG: chromosome segregation protein SMC [Actinobacteria bacterium]|nr:chromosome segregation protein SMC [Actinomycetota bacterium]MBU1942977.1 chromosome segregation protein SMC [Actinomycetota bacterium]MBU2687309.1 chromosome segregation protein SMC [Actinomycetota bacterium]